MNRGSALVETLLLLPVWLTGLTCIALFAMTARETHGTFDRLLTGLWSGQFNDQSVLEIEQQIEWQHADFPRVIVKSGRLLQRDGYLGETEPFLAAVHADGWIPKPRDLQWTQAAVELIRRLGAPNPFSETRPSSITAVGVIGDLHMPLPKRIRPDA